MNLDTNVIWKRFSKSRIVAEKSLGGVREKVITGCPNPDSPEILLDWLAGAKLITPYHAKVLQAGECGPFVFGEYLVLSRIDQGPLAGTFAGLHRATGYAVQMDFLGQDCLLEHDPGMPGANGSASKSGSDAISVTERANELARVTSEFLIPVHELVILPEYAFVVSGRTSGAALSEKVPRKGRLPWQAAVTVVAQVAAALHAMHLAHCVHGRISPKTVWLEGKSRCRLRVEWTSGENVGVEDPSSGEAEADYLAPEIAGKLGGVTTANGDLYSLGALLYRLITGRLLSEASTVQARIDARSHSPSVELERFDLPKQLETLMRELVAADPLSRPTDTGQVLTTLSQFSTTAPADWPKAETLPELLRYRQHLAAAEAFWVAPEMVAGETVSISAEERGDVKEARERSGPVTIADIQKAAQQRKREQWRWTLASLFGFAILTIAVIWGVGRQTIESPNLASSDPNASGTAVQTDDVDSPKTSSPEEPSPDAVLQQFIVDDDGELPWESPTNGRRFLAEYLPVNPRIIVVLRPADIEGIGQAGLALESLSPELRESIDDWKSRFSVQFGDLRQLVVAMYDGDAKFDSLTVAYLGQPVASSRLLALWNSPAEITLSETERVGFALGDTFIVPMISPDSPSDWIGFVAGPKELIEQSAEIGARNSLDGIMADLAGRVDEDRHVSLLFLTSSLFNENGQWLMDGRWMRANRAIREMMSPEIRGGIVSAHWEGADAYLEVILDHSPDMKDAELVGYMRTQFQTAKKNLEAFAQSLPVNSYWDGARQRFDNMVHGLSRLTRIGAERGMAIANVWVPASSVHNLLATSDLALEFGSGVTVVAEKPKMDSPRTIEELLATPRRLQVTTNPDLNVLLSNLQTEINNDYPALPYPFEIRISGNDLVMEGITQNQRPGDFELEKVTVREILTQIVYRANPDKSATGPEDEKCKLIWVLQDAPDGSGQKIVLITTRQAAINNSWELPVEFRVENKP